MRYSQTPRPEVERHYHIEHLITSQEKRTEERNYTRNKAKAKEETEELIKDAKRLVMTDFYCSACQKDFKGLAWKQIEQDWNRVNERVAFYKTKCEKGHWAIRLITDKHKDGFFVKSRLLARERGIYFNDTVQPGDTGYSLLYGKKNA